MRQCRRRCRLARYLANEKRYRAENKAKVTVPAHPPLSMELGWIGGTDLGPAIQGSSNMGNRKRGEISLTEFDVVSSYLLLEPKPYRGGPVMSILGGRRSRSQI